jgi:holo-[acyl-carrier protein] synthase
MRGHGGGAAVTVRGVGIDAVEIARVRTACERTPSLLARLFTELERATCTSRCGDLRFGGLAGRFAAKEAVAKAFGTGIRGFGWRDIEVLSDDLGRPSIGLHGGAADRAAALGVTAVHLSLTTSIDLAIANVVLDGSA